MTLQRRFFHNVAICTSKVASNNFFNVSAKDVESVGLEPGDELRVRITRTDLDRELKPRDSYTYDNKLQKSNQVYIPKDAREALDLRAGDLIKYVIIPKKTFPSLSDGPVRNRVKETMESDEERDRPEPEAVTDEFSGMSMQQTGQITIPKGTRDKLALFQDDKVTLTVEYEGEAITTTKEIGTGNRITLTDEEEEELGLEPGDEPTITVYRRD